MEDVKVLTTDNVEHETSVKSEEDVLMQSLIREFPNAVADIMETISTLKKTL